MFHSAFLPTCIFGLILVPYTVSAAVINSTSLTNVPLNLTSTPANSTTGPADPVTTTLPLSSDSTFDFQLVLALGYASYHGADAGDILKTSVYIQASNFESYADAFTTLALATETAANSTLATSNAINARDAFFAAANYWRNADFFLHGNWSDPRIDDYWAHQTYCFDTALAAMPIPGQRIQIPATGFQVEAIWYQVDNSRFPGKRPTIILGQGYDGSQEDQLHTYGFAALDRGWNVLTYEGPGQPTVRRYQDIGFIPDWERVVSPVVDYLEGIPGVDMERLVLLGESYGGYLAARAAAFEPRIKALVLDGGIYDVYSSWLAEMKELPSLLQLYTSGQKDAFDTGIYDLLVNPKVPSQLRWAIEQGQWAFNFNSTFEWLKSIQNLTVKGFVDQIQMPTWIANAGDDQFYEGQPELVAQALGDKATVYNFTGAAGYHCQVGSFEESNREIFSWLGSVFKL